MNELLAIMLSLYTATCGFVAGWRIREKTLK